MPGLADPSFRSGHSALKLFPGDLPVKIVIQLSGIDQRGRAGLSFYLHRLPGKSEVAASIQPVDSS